MIGRKVESKYYFDGDLSWHVACAGDEVKSLRALEKLFAVRLTARDNWVGIDGEPEAVERTEAFLGELSGFYRIRRKQLESRDFEFLCRSFRDRREGDLRELLKERIDVSPKKREVLPRSRRQLDYVRAIRTSDVVFGVGPAGTGKTYLAMAMAVSEFLKGNVSRIILTRPARESGENLGFLPGSLEEKIMPYLRPLYDALYDMIPGDKVERAITAGVIEIAPLAFMRGRTLANAAVILDEAQNTTSMQMKMFLTRLGENSRMIVTGDPSQVDLPRGVKSGLVEALDLLKGVEGISVVRFRDTDVVRHPLVGRIVQAYDAQYVARAEDAAPPEARQE